MKRAGVFLQNIQQTEEYLTCHGNTNTVQSLDINQNNVWALSVTAEGRGGLPEECEGAIPTPLSVLSVCVCLCVCVGVICSLG